MKKKNNNTPVSSFRLPKETLEKIQKIAKQMEWSKSEVIKRSIEVYAINFD